MRKGFLSNLNLSTLSSLNLVEVVVTSDTLLCLKVHGYTMDFGEVNEQNIS